MVNRWEEFARENPQYYITTWDTDFASDDGRDAFFSSGEREVAAILDQVAPLLKGWGTALEIGCGVGRLTIPMAGRFRSVRAVDVAPSMLAKLLENSAALGVSSIQPFLPEDQWDSDPVDFAYSWAVFQHMEHWDAIGAYVIRIGRCLRPGGLAYLNFDTRPRTIGYRLRGLFPDSVLPRRWRHGIRCIRRSEGDVDKLLVEAGLRPQFDRHSGTRKHVVIARR